MAGPVSKSVVDCCPVDLWSASAAFSADCSDSCSDSVELVSRCSPADRRSNSSSSSPRCSVVASLVFSSRRVGRKVQICKYSVPLIRIHWKIVRSVFDFGILRKIVKFCLLGSNVKIILRYNNFIISCKFPSGRTSRTSVFGVYFRNRMRCKICVLLELSFRTM